jgi:uncharacterized protein
LKPAGTRSTLDALLMIGLRVLAVSVLALVPLDALAQSATPLLDTNPGRGPVLPFGGFDYQQNVIPQRAAANNASAVLGAVLDGQSPDAGDENGRTGLMWAAINNNQLIGKILLEHGANVNVRDKLGNTALHWAAQYDSLGVMHQLLAFGCEVNPQNRQGVTPLMMAANKGRADAVRMLLAAKANPKIQDYTGRDAAGWAANSAIAQILVSAAR